MTKTRITSSSVASAVTKCTSGRGTINSRTCIRSSSIAPRMNFSSSISDQAAFARLLNLNLQFFRGVNLRVARAPGKSQPAQDPPAGPIEQTDRRAEHFEIPLKRGSNQKSDAFRALQAHAFGNEFAEHDVQHVRKRNATASETRMNQNAVCLPGMFATTGLRTEASVDSPSAPSPRLVSVIPT